MRYNYPCNIVPDETEGGWGFVVTFPDLYGANTGGKTFKESIILAEDCLVVTLGAYMDERQELPTPSPFAQGQELIGVQPLIAAQLDLYAAMRKQDITTADLAQRLGISKTAASKLLTLDYHTPIGQVIQALEAVGRKFMAVEDQAA